MRPDEQTAQTDEQQGPTAEGKKLGVTLAPIDDAVRQRLGTDVKGVLVQRVDPNSPAAENGIRPGDLIVSANNREVARASDVAEEWQCAQKEKRPVLLRIKRNDQYPFIAVSS